MAFGVHSFLIFYLANIKIKMIRRKGGKHKILKKFRFEISSPQTLLTKLTFPGLLFQKLLIFAPI